MINNADFVCDLWKKSFEEDHGYSFCSARPLAHYTSLEALENIIKSEEIWLSHPYLMNDIQEMQYGMGLASELLRTSTESKPINNEQDIGRAIQEVLRYIDDFNQTHDVDVFVFCLSAHDRDDPDGVLSMWRTYGGQGNGAALVFNEKLIELAGGSPLKLYEVEYRTNEERINMLNLYIHNWCNHLLTAESEYGLSEISDHDIQQCARVLFHKLLLAALTTKYVGFKEEKEWRLVYLPDSDYDDCFKKYFSYSIKSSGIEPKLKLCLKSVFKNWSGLTLSDLVDLIILGPNFSSPFAVKSTIRMLENNGKSELKDRVVASRIPLRPAR